MKFIIAAVCLIAAGGASAFTPARVPFHHHASSSFSRQHIPLWTAGADIEQDTEESVPTISNSDDDPPSVSTNRGKVNEIDFCIAPADVSLSRSYGTAAGAASTSEKTLSLTRALNNASNRAVRRILLARSWPSAEALNLSLRQVLAAERSSDIPLEEKSTPKCPVPRPILNILVRRRGEDGEGKAPIPKSRTDDEYVADQLAAFRERYSAIPGFALAEAYLECILSLATSGVESPRVSEVRHGRPSLCHEGVLGLYAAAHVFVHLI